MCVRVCVLAESGKRGHWTFSASALPHATSPSVIASAIATDITSEACSRAPHTSLAHFLPMHHDHACEGKMRGRKAGEP